jgi:hypothetical protein
VTTPLCRSAEAGCSGYATLYPTGREIVANRPGSPVCHFRQNGTGEPANPVGSCSYGAPTSAGLPGSPPPGVTAV